MNIKTCLYCNANYTILVRQEKERIVVKEEEKEEKEEIKKKKLFQLDHFFPKSKYPYLSISFANLVPCCSNCNLWKKDTPTTLETFYHPYVEDFSSKFSFKLKDTWTLESYISNTKEFLDFKSMEENDIVKKHLEVFSIREIYNLHREPLLDLLMRRKYYDTSKIEELKNDFSGLNLSESDINDFVLGTYSSDKDINKRPLTKFLQDISKNI